MLCLVSVPRKRHLRVKTFSRICITSFYASIKQYTREKTKTKGSELVRKATKVYAGTSQIRVCNS